MKSSSEVMAEMFMSQGRDGSMSHSDSTESSPCDVADMKMLVGFDATGCAPMAKTDICYSPYGENSRAPEWYRKSMVPGNMDEMPKEKGK